MSPSVDPLLQDLLNAPDDREFARRLQRLLQNEVSRLVTNIIYDRMQVPLLRRPRLFHSQKEEDAEDVYQEAMTGIAARLNQDRNSLRQLTSLKGYVAVTTYRAFYAHLRRKFPARSHLKDEIRSVLKREADLAEWKRLEIRVGGLAVWLKEPDIPIHSPRLQSLCADADSFPPSSSGSANPRLMRMNELLRALFGWLAHPVELDMLTNLTAQQWGLRDLEFQSTSRSEAAGEVDSTLQIADSTADVPTIAARNALFARLWEQIAQLPPSHCAALLLNFKDDGGRLISVFTDLQIVTQRQIAAAMGLSLVTLNTIWDDIPLDDNTIAELLGISRQQVINCRSAARERLKKRADQILPAE